MEFIGREKELAEIRASMATARNEFVAVYGRRRVGKTELINKALEGQADFYYTGIYGASKQTQIGRFLTTLGKYGYSSESKCSTWFRAFDALKRYLLSLGKECVCVFIDELPWMDSKNSGFIPAFADFWNTWGTFNPHRVLLKLYVCGSATTWMIHELLNAKGGLHNRLTREISLKQFTMAETEKYFRVVLGKRFSKAEVLDIYMTVGGVPYYLSKFDKNLPIAKQIDALFFAENGVLSKEYSRLYEALFNDSKSYRKLITALCEKYKGLTREDLAASTGIEGGELTTCLENLQNCDFVRKYNVPMNAKKDALYQIIDLYTIFYQKFIAKENHDETFWSNSLQSSKINAWRGFAFERVLFLHVEDIKRALGISGISCGAYSWRSKGANPGYQIDLIIDRADNVMNICEIKYGRDVFCIDEEYGAHIRQRIEAFRAASKTKKTLKNTFITMYGVKESSGFGVDNSLTLEDLFNE